MMWPLVARIDELEQETLKIINDSDEPLETKEIMELVSKKIEDVTRTKLINRLNNLRGEGLIKAKFIGPGKGVWIWWRVTYFKK